MSALTTAPNTVDSDMIAEVVKKLSEQNVKAEDLISEEIVSQVHASCDRVRSWFKYEIFLTKVLIAGVVSAEQFESAVLPLLKSQMDRCMMHKFGSCLKGTVSSYRSSKRAYRDEEFVQVLEWIGWLCSSSADI